MTVEIDREVVTATSPELVFSYLSDYRNVPDWLFGVERFTPTGSQTTGLGARFDAAVSLGITVKSQIAVSEWEEGKVLGFTSIKGFKNATRWEVVPAPDGGSRLLARVTYDLPLGPAGRALGKTITPFISAAVNRTMADLTHNLNQLSLAN